MSNNTITTSETQKSKHVSNFNLIIKLDILFNPIKFWQNLQKHPSNTKHQKLNGAKGIVVSTS